MDFVCLGTVLAGIAESVELHPHFDDRATRIGKISRAAADAFWQEHNPKIEWARKTGWAAMLLNKALHDSDAPPQWMAYDEQKRFAVRTDEVRSEGIDLLTHATGWGNRVQSNCSDHFRAAITEGDAALSMPVQHGINDGPEPRASILRMVKIGFDRGELVGFLERNQIRHQLGTTDATPIHAAKPVTQKKWTPEKLGEIEQYRKKHTMAQTAQNFGISQQRIRQLLPTKKLKATPFAGLGGRKKEH